MKATLTLLVVVSSVMCFLIQVPARQTVEHFIQKEILRKQPENSFSKTVDGISGSDIIQKYLATLGGKESLNQIQTLDFQGKISINGMELNYAERKETPNRDYITLSVDKDTIMRSFFDGATGYNQQPGQKTSLTDDDIKERNSDYLGLFNQVHYLKDSASFILKNLSKVSSNDSTVYQLDIAMPSGKIVSEFYDAQSFLLVKTVEIDTKNSDTVTTSKSFSNYRSINGIRFPFKIDIVKTQSGKEQILSINIDATQINLPEE